MKKITTQEFINKAREVHMDKYDYSKTIYNNTKSKIIIICKNHGFFEQTPGAHINNKQGCPSCGGTKKLTTQEFIKKATNIHGDFYDYSGVVYINSKRKVSIKCHLHGEFFQKPNHHLHGHRCPECGLEKISKTKSENPPGWAYGEWEKAANKSKLFDSFKVYLIKCSGNGEVFYKIGKTFSSINKRFKPSLMPYNFKVLETITGDAYQISELERLIQDENKKYRYNPNLKFSGMHECFSNPPQKQLLEYQKQLLQIN